VREKEKRYFGGRDANQLISHLIPVLTAIFLSEYGKEIVYCIQMSISYKSLPEVSCAVGE